MKRHCQKRHRAVRWAFIGLLTATFNAAENRPAYSQSDIVSAELVAEFQSIQPGKTFWLAVRLEIEDTWYVNWINPGDAGLAPSIKWKLPEGFVASEVLWPFPRRHRAARYYIFGYENVVYLLTECTPPPDLKSGARVDIAADIGWTACREACVPGEAQLSLKLPVTLAAPKPAKKWSEAFESTRLLHPLPSAGWSVRASMAAEKITLEVRRPAGTHTRMFDCFFYPFDQGIIDNASPQDFELMPGGFNLVIERAAVSRKNPTRIAGVLVADSGWDDEGRRRAISIYVPVESR